MHAIPLTVGLLALGLGLGIPGQSAADPLQRVYIGTYTSTDSKGIYLVELDRATGKLNEPVVAAEISNPSFLALHPTQPWLYACSEVSDLNGQKTGGVSAFVIDGPTGKLTLLNQQVTNGGAPCHVSVDPVGKTLLVANYGGGSVASFPLNADGSLNPAATVIEHTGSSVDKSRQEAPHAHSINVDAKGNFAVAADLGLDKLLVYRLDSDTGTLRPHNPPSTSTKPGGGPRHFAFHPGGMFAYTCLEMTSEVTALQWHATQGTLGVFQTLSTLPEPVPGNSTAEVQVHPSGKFVYVSNRGHNSLAIFHVNPKTGALTAAGHQSTLGQVPRNFGIDPLGTFVIAANQESNDLFAFRVNLETGALEPTGSSVKVPKPVCVKYAR